MPVSETSVGDEDLARRVDELLDPQRAIRIELKRFGRPIAAYELRRGGRMSA
jgi:hypothetical protein